MSGCADSSGYRIQCPAMFILLDFILEETRGNLPYRMLFVKCSFQDIFRALRSIRVLSSNVFSDMFSVHDSDPYISTLSTVATNILLLSGKYILDFHIMCMLCSAFHARAFHTLLSYSDELITSNPRTKVFEVFFDL